VRDARGQTTVRVLVTPRKRPARDERTTRSDVNWTFAREECQGASLGHAVHAVRRTGVAWLRPAFMCAGGPSRTDCAQLRDRACVVVSPARPRTRCAFSFRLQVSRVYRAEWAARSLVFLPSVIPSVQGRAERARVRGVTAPFCKSFVVPSSPLRVSSECEEPRQPRQPIPPIPPPWQHTATCFARCAVRDVVDRVRRPRPLAEQTTEVLVVP